jgi:hypothetical protein
VTATETETEVTAEQRVHADVHDVSEEKLAKIQKTSEQEMDTTSGGEICGVCHVKGCRIGPMVRG